MLVTLSDMKSYLGLTVTTYDAFLNEQLTFISDVVEAYCRRKFAETSYIQTFYGDDHYNSKFGELPLFHYPLTEVTSAELDEVDVLADLRIHSPTAIIKRNSGLFTAGDSVLVVEYSAGYTEIPSVIQGVVKSIVEERYNKKISGVNLNFGSDIQRISIPGSISIDFDYTLANNERKSAYGTIIGNQANVLDDWRSERSVIGSGKLEYVEEEEVGP